MATKKIQTIHELGTNTDKSWRHQYLHVYEALFEPIRSKVKTVLEIGIFDGWSHKMWKDYFPKATIYGLDIDNRVMEDLDMERLSFQFCNAYTSECVESFSGTTFDVIVDDGPHTLDSQAFCVANYSKLLSKNGILVVEDIPNYDWTSTLAESVPEDLKPYCYIIDRRIAPNRQSISDEIMFVIDKRFV